MTVDSQTYDLSNFDSEYVGPSKGALSMVLIVNRNMRGRTFPVKSKDFETAAGGQVANLGGGAIKKILAEYGIARILSSEGGRTSRGNMERMRRYVELANRLAQSGALDIEAAEKFWIGRVQAYFDAMPFSLKLDPSKSLRACIRQLLDQAIARQQETSGTMYAGAMMQHLVGAKLRVVSPGVLVTHGFSVADASTNRSADFTLDDSAIHVTSAPSSLLLEKCRNNLSVGLRPIVITTEDGVGGARALGKLVGIEDRIDIIEIEQFLAMNVYERSAFRRDARPDFVRTLIGVYNEIVAEAETDPSLRIEFDQ